jgi:penicillin-binding protein 1A
MAAALKDKPAIPFRIPPGIRLVRVDAATGQLPRPGDKNVIYEAFKPGTEPTGETSVVANGNGMTEDTAELAVPGAASTSGALLPTRAAPGSGTGGLY